MKFLIRLLTILTLSQVLVSVPLSLLEVKSGKGIPPPYPLSISDQNLMLINN
jgi:hypothetical protein